jgi:hypothetical protein
MTGSNAARVGVSLRLYRHPRAIGNVRQTGELMGV